MPLEAYRSRLMLLRFLGSWDLGESSGVSQFDQFGDLRRINVGLPRRGPRKEVASVIPGLRNLLAPLLTALRGDFWFAQ